MLSNPRSHALPFALASSVVMLSSSIAMANENAVRLSDTVVTASGFEQKITEAPASISVISNEDLQQKRYNSLAHALGDVEGIDIGQSTGKTGGLNISIRGMPSEYSLILIDGRRQNAAGNVTPNGFNETSTSFMPPLSAIERIEVIRGPMSTLYGSDAMGGVVNIVTKKVTNEWVGSVTLGHTVQEDSSYGDTSSTSFFASGPLVENLLGLQVRGSLFDREESNLSYGDGVPVNTRGPSPVDGRNHNIGARLTLTPHQNHDIAFDVERGRQRYNNDESQLGTIDEVPTETDLAGGRISGYSDELRFEREQFALTHTGRFDMGMLQTSLMHNTTETIGRTIPGGNDGGDFGQPVPALSDIIIGTDRELETTNLVFDTKLVSPIGDSHILTTGGQWWEAEMTDGLATEDYEQTTWALFAEDEWRLRDDLALTLGARYDEHEAFGGQVSPRAYVVWNTTDNWTLKGGISRGYRTPDLNDLHVGVNGVTGQGERLTIGNPDLDPETTTSSELGIYYDNFEGFNTNITLFHNKFEDKIDTLKNVGVTGRPGVPDGAYDQKINIDEAVTQGIELAARLQLAPNWALSGNYTFTDSEQRSGINKGEALTNTPEHLANIRLDWQATGRTNLWLKSEYRGTRSRFTSRYENLVNNNGSYSTDQSIYDTLGDNIKAYTLFHLGGSFQASDTVTLNATIYNLFDKDFLDGTPYETYDNSGDLTGTSWGTDYVHSTRSTTGVLEEGRRLWLSATMEF